MKHVRAVVKLLLITVYTLGLYGAYLFGWAAILLFRLRIEPWRNFILRNWSAGTCLILNMHVRTVGQPPRPPFFLVSNHLSYTDIFAYYRTLKCTFIAKQEVKSWPLIGFIVKTMGVIFVDRGRKRDVTRVNDLVSGGLNKDQGIILFPEGRTSKGKEVLPFKTSLLEPPAAENFPVHFSTVHYRTSSNDEPAHLSICWWGEASFIKHFFILASLRRIECTLTFGTETVQHENRKQLADLLHQRISAQFQPVIRPEEVADLHFQFDESQQK